MTLSLLSTMKDHKSLVNDDSIALLIGHLAKCVRKELTTQKDMWSGKRCTWIIRTLEKMLTSDAQIVATLIKLNLLTFLGKVLDESFCSTESQRANELCAALTCLRSLSQCADALSRIARDASLVKGMSLHESF